MERNTCTCYAWCMYLNITCIHFIATKRHVRWSDRFSSSTLVTGTGLIAWQMPNKREGKYNYQKPRIHEDQSNPRSRVILNAQATQEKGTVLGEAAQISKVKSRKCGGAKSWMGKTYKIFISTLTIFIFLTRS